MTINCNDYYNILTCLLYYAYVVNYLESILIFVFFMIIYRKYINLFFYTHTHTHTHKN